jgi:hypothetical protein
MTKTKSTIMMENSLATKKYIAKLLEENQISTPKELWMDFAMILGQYTPIWLMPDMHDKGNVRLWNLLTHDVKEREYEGSGLGPNDD